MVNECTFLSDKLYKCVVIIHHTFRSPRKLVRLVPSITDIDAAASCLESLKREGHISDGDIVFNIRCLPEVS